MIDERYFWSTSSQDFRGIPNLGPGRIHDKMRGLSTTLHSLHMCLPPSFWLWLRFCQYVTYAAWGSWKIDLLGQTKGSGRTFCFKAHPF
ncbi:uncharacterized protein LOC116585644 isoform X2 [Mustela erminea]|uniref:uncharacterized protein LOC116585644 isoform X2 n=1 Tax=Mustela erminea TaxID=36723 RepID=UPI001386E89A|nr:uncharacterized protein LOC116585644 isoform X2 [Mustela erminea]